MSTQTALDGLFGAPATIAGPPPVPVEVATVAQPVPVIVIAQPVRPAPARALAAPCCLASRRRPATGYPFQAGAERQRRFAEREQVLQRLRDEESAWVMPSRAVIERDDSLEGLGI